MQVGDEVPDVAPSALKGAWEATQQLLRQRKISAGHDISDGGLATALLEMSFSGNTGISVSMLHRTPPSMHRAGARAHARGLCMTHLLFGLLLMLASR